MKKLKIIGLTLLMLTNTYSQVSDDSIVIGTIDKFKITNKSNFNLKLETTGWEGDADTSLLSPNNSIEFSPMFLHLNGNLYSVKISFIYQNYLIEFYTIQIPSGTWEITNENLKKMAQSSDLDISRETKNKAPVL